MTEKLRTPRVGDIVGITGQRGTFVVASIDHHGQKVNLDSLGSQGPKAFGVSWASLTYRDALDESQNALRVVREATED
jgi:hypothetical protein